MPDPAARQEYLLEDTGKIYAGSHSAVRGRPWSFGQFEDIVLPAVCHLLEGARSLRPAERASPVKVARAISAMVRI